MFITDALALSHIPRWVIVPLIRSQSVAEHSFNVAMIASEIMQRAPQVEVRPLNVLWHALTHDIDECVTGDLPSTAKRLLKPDYTSGLVLDKPDIKVTLVEHNLVKLADIIEAYTFCAKNAHSEHAKNVRDHYLYPRLTAAVHGSIFNDYAPLMDMVADIIAERGRLRPEDWLC